MGAELPFLRSVFPAIATGGLELKKKLGAKLSQRLKTLDNFFS